jgi:hypothetical protein
VTLDDDLREVNRAGRAFADALRRALEPYLLPVMRVIARIARRLGR